MSFQKVKASQSVDSASIWDLLEMKSMHPSELGSEVGQENCVLPALPFCWLSMGIVLSVKQ